MQDNKDVLVTNWLFKSEEALKSTGKNIEINEFYTAQNRLYYTLFYAVSALAQKNGFATSKHSQLKGWFNREYIKTKKISQEYGELYFDLYEARQKSDYAFNFKPKKENLLSDLVKVNEFIEIIRKELE
ncbi:MAG: HEPN domain-containing protein [Candidatus Gastranaerophilales bacterium]|nr:HEPN domain-containing protein [Candidatus Gastranaerophilales bacterium]